MFMGELHTESAGRSSHILCYQRGHLLCPPQYQQIAGGDFCVDSPTVKVKAHLKSWRDCSCLVTSAWSSSQVPPFLSLFRYNRQFLLLSKSVQSSHFSAQWNKGSSTKTKHTEILIVLSTSALTCNTAQKCSSPAVCSTAFPAHKSAAVKMQQILLTEPPLSREHFCACQRGICHKWGREGAPQALHHTVVCAAEISWGLFFSCIVSKVSRNG